MALIKPTINIEQVNFRFSIPRISKLNDIVWSPEVLVNGVPWKVYAHKNTVGTQSWLAVHLHCGKPAATSNWSCVASATFELVPFKSGCAAKKRETGPFVFDHFDKNYGYLQFIRWTDLFNANNGYVKDDDSIDLQIKIHAESNNASVASFESIKISCDQGCLSKFRLTVSDIGNLLAMKTPEFFLQGVPCTLGLSKYSNNVSIRFDANPNDSVSQDIKFSVQLTVELISTKVSMGRSEIVYKTIDRNERNFSIWDLISWDELLEAKNGFITNGAVTIGFEIRTELLQGGPILSAQKRKATNDLQPAAKHLKLDCKICKKEIIDQDISSLPCGHVFCSSCITKSIRVRKVCPSCGVRVTQNGVRRILLPKSDKSSTE